MFVPVRTTVFLLLLSFPTFAQDPDGKSDCEEAWNYVEFLKTKVTEAVNTILQETLYDAKLRPSQEGLEETLEVTMRQVMEVRENLLERIKALRKGEEKVCPEHGVRQEKGLSAIRKDVMELLLKIIDGTPASLDKIKSISKQLLRLKLVVQNEVMRLLLLPAPGSTTVVVSSGDCAADCQGLQTIAAQLNKLLECARDQPIEDIDLPVSGSPVVERPTARAVDCPQPQMFSMQLIAVNERIDNEIKTLYNLLVIEIEEEERLKHIGRLDFFKTIRAGVEEVITSLMKEDEDEKLKRVIVRGVVTIIRAVTLELKSCGAGCGPPCDSCGGEVVKEGLAKLEEYRELLEQGGDEASREFIRDDLISFIQGNNQEGRDILIRKANEEEVDECEQQKLEVFGETKGPYWMLVNATIFTPSAGEILVIVTTMEEVLNMKLEEYCGSQGNARRTADGNCKWDEYEATKPYLEKLDLIIQENLFKADEEDDKMKALLGFVDLQGMLEKRVKVLFQNKLACPGEVDVIKKQYMDRVTQCMAQMMNPRVQFETMSRRARIQCTKELRTVVEGRIQTLLKDELEESLNNLEGDPELPPFLSNPDSPIEDIDLPVNGPEVLRPGVSRAANFLCKDGATLISIDKRCDGKNDCPLTETSTGGEDEENCDEEGSGQVA